MSAKEIVLSGGLTKVRVNDVAGTNHVALQISNPPGDSSMLAVLDRAQQHLLLLYLEERLRGYWNGKLPSEGARD